MRVLPTLLAFGALIVAQPADAVDAASAVETPAAVASAPADMRLELARVVVRYRLIGATSVEDMLDAMPAADQASLALLRQLVQSGHGPMLSDFLRTSIPYFKGNEREAVVGFWNPYVDAWLLTGWSNREDGWHATELHAMNGPGLANTPAAIGPKTVKKNMIDLQAQRAAEFNAYERPTARARAASPKQDEASAWALLIRRQVSLASRNAEALKNPAWSGLLSAIDARYVSEPPETGMNADFRNALLKLPTPVRLSLRPTLLAANADRVTVVLTSSFAPGVLLTANLKSMGAGNFEFTSEQLGSLAAEGAKL